MAITLARAGIKRHHLALIEARINGEVRFYQGDRIKVRLRERQIIEGSKSKMEYGIIEVLEYCRAGPLRFRKEE